MQKKIIHMVHKMNKGGGVENVLMNYYRNVDTTRVQFVFLFPSEEKADFDQEIIDLQGEMISVTGREENFFKNLIETIKVFREKSDIKIVHIHVADASKLVDGIIAKLCRKKVIFHSHTIYPNNSFIAQLKRRVRIPLFRLFGNQFLGCSQEAGQYFFGKSIIHKKSFEIFKNAIDLNNIAFNPDIRKEVRDELRLNNQFVIGQVGRFSDEKNHDFTLKVFIEVLKQNTNSILLLVGGGHLLEETKEKVRKLGIQEKVIFTGLRSDVSRLLQGMDALIFPSKYEGLGMVLIEAQASGLACLSSSIVPKESKVTDRIEYYSIEESPKKWADWLCQVDINFNRAEQVKIVADFGYDIHQQVEWLVEYYEKIV